MLIATGVSKLDKWEKQTGALLFIGIFRFLEGLSEAAKVPTEPYPLLPLSVRFFLEPTVYFYLYIYRYYIYIYIIMNWLTWLWRLRRSKICCWQSGDPGKLLMLNSSPKAGRLKTQEKPIFQFEIKGKKIKQCSSSSKQAGGFPSYSTFLFYLGPQSIGWGLPTLGRAICNY